ncbi:general secretion pathway protein GspB [Massilia sp. TWR1-2-2]|uniref:general secretion pathway protein GspB n=1 Tax=Massilia sp. TWR1-2-2 TaxID=2804584 RepID=UPI003CEBA279
MSYILEALKKSQAERQLGSAPTINAIAVGAAPRADGRSSRRPVWIALSAAALALALALLAWRLMSAVPAPAVAVLAATPPPVAAVAAPPPAMAAVAPPLAMVPPSSPEPARAAPRSPPPASVKAALPVTAPAPAKAAAPAPSAADDERLPTLRELPEAIQRTVPPLTFGGYMYSKNPADRLLLIDKALRREGEEVAPGLVLEKLLPKEAVMNFNGYRYRVPY